MREDAARWLVDRGSRSSDWPLAEVLAAKRSAGLTVSVVIPARNEAATIGAIVKELRSDLVDGAPVIDELIVMDSLSSDATADVAASAGASVHSVADVVPELGVHPGKGEALWKAQFVTSGDILVFLDGDLMDWGTHFVTGLLGPLCVDPGILLNRGHYDRLTDPAGAQPLGGRVTELLARPLLALRWPSLSGVMQPLAGEWAIRRSLFETLSVPVGYGIELSTLIDTFQQSGLDALAQVDLGQRAHRSRALLDLSVMSTEILRIADVRSGHARAEQPPAVVELQQPDRSRPGEWMSRPVPVGERPPAVSVPAYAAAVRR